MEYYYIYKYLFENIESKITRCHQCNKIILQNPIQYKLSQLCSFMCLTKHVK